jgi:hypothetical protein
LSVPIVIGPTLAIGSLEIKRPILNLMEPRIQQKHEGEMLGKL